MPCRKMVVWGIVILKGFYFSCSIFLCHQSKKRKANFYLSYSFIAAINIGIFVKSARNDLAQVAFSVWKAQCFQDYKQIFLIPSRQPRQRPYPLGWIGNFLILDGERGTMLQMKGAIKHISATFGRPRLKPF